MLYMAIFDAKEDTKKEDILREREAWFTLGNDRMFRDKCGRIERYEVAGRSPLRIFFLIETDNPGALNILSRHFGDEWNSTAYPLVERELHTALEEDRHIIGG